MIAILNYGVGNLASVEKAFKKLGFPAEITDSAAKIRSADRVIFPGVGAFGSAIQNLEKTGLKSVLQKLVRQNVPILGICLGHQLLFTDSEEHGFYTGLNLIPGHVKRLPNTVRIPHIGWNQVKFTKASPLFYEIPDESYFYFADSYYSETDEVYQLATTAYGLTFTSVAQNELIFGVQFHPEKSQDAGLQLLENFVRKI
ncbi:imidazole glycerol phosphate synthase subunit HisH 1 [bacterium BMS3Abin05]|nr:imidazole glycerol phosphate synthase subunit HisH 1 [bacterium BMS3Abin05]GBE26848.1 imidazole glycerol phosphate synthase subunit HisH 1 [bacterium BMS3Bbin03]